MKLSFLSVGVGLLALASGCGLALDYDPPEDAGGSGFDGGARDGSAGDGGVFDGGGVRSCTDDGDCEARDACETEGRCVEGVCHPGPALTCNDGIDCTEDSCDPDDGCVFEPDDTVCGDASGCLVTECVVGAGCVTSPDPTECRDDETCSADICLADGSCVNERRDEICERLIGAGSVCDDTGECTPIDCETVADCPGSTECRQLDGCASGFCAYSPRNPGGSCDDGDPCTTSSICNSIACVPLDREACDDGEDCTDDRCVPVDESAFSCQHTNLDRACDSGVACTTPGYCVGGTCEPGIPTCPPEVAGDCISYFCNGGGCGMINHCGANAVCLGGDVCGCQMGFEDCGGFGDCTCPTSTHRCEPDGLGCVPRGGLADAGARDGGVGVACPLDVVDCDGDGICECDTRVSFCGADPVGSPGDQVCLPPIPCGICGTPSETCCPCTGRCCDPSDAGCCLGCPLLSGPDP